MTLAVDRFERRLTDEISSLRVDFTRDVSGLRQDIGRQISDVRHDLRQVRVELFKWSFLFWIGQVAAVAGLLALMLRAGA